MQIINWEGFSKIVGLVRAGLPLSAISNECGIPVHIDAQPFLRTDRRVKYELVRALVASHRNYNIQEFERLIVGGKEQEQYNEQSKTLPA